MELTSRPTVISSDYSGQLTYLLRYPSDATPTSPTVIHTSLLLQQAQALQASATPSTGVTIVMQNRDLLGIPVDVPIPEVEPPRRRPARGGAAPGRGGIRFGSQTLGRTLSDRRDPFGIPEMIAKGLWDINGAVSSTVSEIRVSLCHSPHVLTTQLVSRSPAEPARSPHAVCSSNVTRYCIPIPVHQSHAGRTTTMGAAHSFRSGA